MIKWFKHKNKTKQEPETLISDGEDEPRDLIAPESEGQVEEEFSPEDRRPETTVLESAVGAEYSESQGVEEEEEQTAGSPHFEPPFDATDAEREKGRFFKKLRQRLHKTREQFASKVDRLVLGKKTIDVDLLDDLEEVLITSDLGVHTTQVLLGKVAEKIKRRELKDPSRLKEHLREEIKTILLSADSSLDLRSRHPMVIMAIGINGVGKTTTVGKLAYQLKQMGLNVMLVAADTFRAAAVEQLMLWGERAGVPVVHQKSGSDPSAVAFDAIDAAVSRNVDVVLIDTAGRMHTKVNLMEELKKIQRVICRKIPEAPHEILLVLDASTGQNALSQARLFKESMGITGMILTKLDGTARGGIVVAICDELQVPVRYIGIGEGIDDLRPFDPDEFTRALF